MKNLALLFLLLTTVTAQAAVERRGLDLKLPTQQMVEKQAFGSPVAASTTRLSNAIAGIVTAITNTGLTVSSFTLQPDVPRNIVITPGGTSADVGDCTITVNGTNIQGRVISETFTAVANSVTALTGAKAFKTVSSVVMPAACEDAPYTASWSIGVGEKIGLNHCLSTAGDWFHSSVSGTKEATAATLVLDDDEVEKNTADFVGSMTGSAPFIGYFMQNYRCP